MLGMIEINLLPQEFRPSKGTNFPLMASVAVGMFVVGGVILYGIKLKNELAALNSHYKELDERRITLEAEVKKVKDLKAEIARQKARQDTIIEIAESKVMWSLKLQQLSELMKDFPGFWVKRMQLTKSSKSSLSMDVSATGSDLRRVARFRDTLKNDPNFFYHFDDLKSEQVRIVQLQKKNFTEEMDFKIELPLLAATMGGK